MFRLHIRRMWFPTLEEILTIHDTIIIRTGGASGVLHAGAVASAIERARWGPFEAGGDAAERAALLLRGIVLDHPFADGNKRTAFEATDLLLRRNGYALDAPAGEVVSFMLAVAREGQVVAEIASWLRRRVRKVDGVGA